MMTVQRTAGSAGIFPECTMLEAALEKLSSRQPEILDSVLQRMRALHAHSATEKADEDRIMEGMSNQIMGETTQKAHLALADQETRALVERAQQEHWSEQRLQQSIAATRQRIAAEIFKEHWFESTLSTPDFPIHAATYGTWMFRYDLRRLMAENPSLEHLSTFGWLRFDGDGLRSFKDCTSHMHTTYFLQQMARIFVDPHGPTRTHLEEQGVCVIPMATGGDEYDLYLRGSAPLTPELIDGAAASYQSEISTSEILSGCLDFDDERVLITYGLPSSKLRKEFLALSPEQRREKLKAIRATLQFKSSTNGKFIASVAGGGALLTEGILLAVEKDDHDLQGGDETFTTLREKIVQSTIDLARDRQERKKEETMQALEHTDPNLYRFRLRNQQNRRLHEEKRKAEERAKRAEERAEQAEERAARLERESATSRQQAAGLLGTPQAGSDQ